MQRMFDTSYDNIREYLTPEEEKLTTGANQAIYKRLLSEVKKDVVSETKKKHVQKKLFDPQKEFVEFLPSTIVQQFELALALHENHGKPSHISLGPGQEIEVGVMVGRLHMGIEVLRGVDDSLVFSRIKERSSLERFFEYEEMAEACLRVSHYRGFSQLTSESKAVQINALMNSSAFTQEKYHCSLEVIQTVFKQFSPAKIETLRQKELPHLVNDFAHNPDEEPSRFTFQDYQKFVVAHALLEQGKATAIKKTETLPDLPKEQSASQKTREKGYFYFVQQALDQYESKYCLNFAELNKLVEGGQFSPLDKKAQRHYQAKERQVLENYLREQAAPHYLPDLEKPQDFAYILKLFEEIALIRKRMLKYTVLLNERITNFSLEEYLNELSIMENNYIEGIRKGGLREQFEHYYDLIPFYARLAKGEVADSVPHFRSKMEEESIFERQQSAENLDLMRHEAEEAKGREQTRRNDNFFSDLLGGAYRHPGLDSGQ